MPTFKEALQFWVKLGLISFGGPAGQIAIMHRELVEKKKWISEQHFLHALNYCMLLPGPEAQQLATYLGWRLHGFWGGLAAGVLFVLPGALVLFVLSWVYMVGGELTWVNSIFHGLMAAVIAIVAEAVLRVGRKALKSSALWVVAGMSFVAIFFFNVPFPLIILAAGVIGFFGHKFSPSQFPAAGGKKKDEQKDDAIRLSEIRHGGIMGSFRVVLTGIVLWLSPVIGVGLLLGWDTVWVKLGIFFSQAALITFGGAYAVLPYVAQHAVEHHGWLTQEQMMAGLALAETTPGPLIMVLQFVGFVGAWQNPGVLSPLISGCIGALLTTWCTFVPSFIFIFVGGPHVERLGNIPALSASLTGITAAVVGAILNLGVVFALLALDLGSGNIDWFVLTLGVLSFFYLERWKGNMLILVASCGLIGWLYGLSY